MSVLSSKPNECDQREKHFNMYEDEDDFSDEIDEQELFEIVDVKVDYHRSKDQKRVTATFKSDTAISEMRLLLIYEVEVARLRIRLGICEPHDGFQ